MGYLVLSIIISGFTIFVVGALFKPEQKENVSKYPYSANIESDIILISTSWSDDYFDGKITASGEVFDSNGFTAGHPTLPFGTYILITNPNNGNRIKVRINDRISNGLVVSQRVAQALDLKDSITEVYIKIITTVE